MSSLFQILKSHRLLITTAFFLMFFSSLGQTVFIGVYMEDIRAHFDLSKSDIGLYYAIATLSSAFFLLWSGKQIDHMPMIRFLSIALIFLALGCFMLVFVPYGILLIPAFFLIRQCGQGIMTLSANTCINRYIREGTGRAIAFSNLGISTHMFLMPLFGLFLARFVSWQTAWICFGLFILFCLLPFFRFLLRNHEGTIHTAWRKEMDLHTENNLPGMQTQWSRLDVLKDWRFYSIISVGMIAPFMTTAIFFFQNVVAIETSVTTIEFTSSFAAFSLCAIFAIFGAGAVIDKYGEVPLLFFYPLCYAGGLTCLIFANDIISVTIAMGIIGIAGATAGTVGGPLLTRMYGTKHFGSVKSFLFFTNVCSSALSPFLIGLMLDYGTPFLTLTRYVIAYTVIAVLALIPALINISRLEK